MNTDYRRKGLSQFHCPGSETKDFVSFITAFQLPKIHWIISKLGEQWLLQFLHHLLVRQSNLPCCYTQTRAFVGRNVITQSSPYRIHPTKIPLTFMQV